MALTLENKQGLIAGDGILPVKMAQYAKENGFDVVCISLSNDNFKDLQKYCTKVYRCHPGEVNRIEQILKDEETPIKQTKKTKGHRSGRERKFYKPAGKDRPQHSFPIGKEKPRHPPGVNLSRHIHKHEGSGDRANNQHCKQKGRSREDSNRPRTGGRISPQGAPGFICRSGQPKQFNL